MIKAKLSCELKALDRLLHRVMPPDQVKCLLLHGLRIDGDTADAVLAQNLQLLLGDGVWSSRLHRKFHTIGKIKAALDLADQAVELVRLQRRRCSATYIYGIELLMVKTLCGEINLLFQGIQIRIYLFPPR